MIATQQQTDVTPLEVRGIVIRYRNCALIVASPLSDKTQEIYASYPTVRIYQNRAACNENIARAEQVGGGSKVYFKEPYTYETNLKEKMNQAMEAWFDANERLADEREDCASNYGMGGL